MNESTEKKLQQMQLFEQQIQHLASQKQQIQMQIVEINSAMEELSDKEIAYKILGGIMVKRNSKDLKAALAKDGKVLALKMEKLEEQEEKIHIKAKKLQEEVLKEMKGAENE
ncbi:MAG: prefoldin subunit [Nanoarchaeota archaeon]|nr:prefoldin subunit [Nanoarchaeota archaeon]